jgi:hypothetical protein
MKPNRRAGFSLHVFGFTRSASNLLMFIPETSDNDVMAVGLRALEPGQPDLAAGVTASSSRFLFFSSLTFRVLPPDTVTRLCS